MRAIAEVREIAHEQAVVTLVVPRDRARGRFHLAVVAIPILEEAPGRAVRVLKVPEWQERAAVAMPNDPGDLLGLASIGGAGRALGRRPRPERADEDADAGAPR